MTAGRRELSLLALRLAERAGFLDAGAAWAEGDYPALREHAARLREATGGALPPQPLPARGPALAVLQPLGASTPDAASALCSAGEQRAADELGPAGRRRAGLFYTPASVADAVVEVALAQGGDALAAAIRRGTIGVLDPCAGSGAFLLAAARALRSRLQGPGARAKAALACRGADLDRRALQLARASLALQAGPGVAAAALRGLDLRCGDALRLRLPEADLLVSNPPYGHVESAAERTALAARFPGLRGAEIDRYAVFLLRALELVRPGGTAALLVPDSWLGTARGGALRRALLGQAELAAVVDLGKPFAAAKDTRVHAVVLVRRAAAVGDAGPRRRRSATFVARAGAAGAPLEELCPADEQALWSTVDAGWPLYRTRVEQAFVEALQQASVPLGEICEVGYGLRTGANATHVEREAPRRAGEVGLVGGEDIGAFALRWHPKRLRATSRETFDALLRRQLGRPRLAVQRIRTNGRAPWLRWLEAAPVPAELACLDSLSTVACESEERLWALLALLGSVALDRFHRLRTTDVNVKPSALRTLPAPRRLLEPGGCERLAALARARAAEPDPALERAIDAEVYALYGLPEQLVRAVERAHWGERFESEYEHLRLLSDPLGTVSAC